MLARSSEQAGADAPGRRSRGVQIAGVSAVVMAAVVATLVGVLTPWHPLPGSSFEPATLSSYFSGRQVARSEAFHDAAKWPSWWALALHVLVPVTAALTTPGRRLLAVVRSSVRGWPLQVVALATAVLVAQRVSTLPFDAWAHSVAVSYGLSTQSWASWGVDAAKTLGIGVVLTAVALLALVAVARHFPTTWFAPAGVAAAVFVVLGSFAYPVVFEPVFNRFTPMADGPLRTELLTLAARDDAGVTDVLVADASRRTTALNAYVSGFGASKRVVVYDTLLASSSDDEVAVVVAHELGHATADDVVVGTVEGAAGAGFGVMLLYLILSSRPVQRAAGVTSAADPSVVPLVLALVTVGSLLALPVQNTVSRQIEARADAHALLLGSDPATFIDVQQQLAVSNLSHLEPNSVLAFWFSSHPDALSRIGMALAFERMHGGGGEAQRR